MWDENFNKKHTKFGLIAMSAILFAAVPTVTISLMSTEDAFARNGMYTSDTSQAAAGVPTDPVSSTVQAVRSSLRRAGWARS